MQASNETLVQRIQQGERELMPVLWDQVQAFVRQQANRWVNAWSGSRPDVTFEDLYQCGYIALCGAVESYQPDKEATFIGWLAYYLKTAFAEEIGCRTKKKLQDPLNHATRFESPVVGEEELLLGDTIADPTDYCEDLEQHIYQEHLRTVLEDAMEILPENQRAILAVRFFDGLTPDETANRLGISTNAVRQREVKALRTLQWKAVALKAFWDQEHGL